MKGEGLMGTGSPILSKKKSVVPTCSPSMSSSMEEDAIVAPRASSAAEERECGGDWIWKERKEEVCAGTKCGFLGFWGFWGSGAHFELSQIHARTVPTLLSLLAILVTAYF